MKSRMKECPECNQKDAIYENINQINKSMMIVKCTLCNKQFERSLHQMNVEGDVVIES